MKHIQIYDTTLRDGSQAEGINFSLRDKCQLAERLDSLGFDFIEGGYPASNVKDSTFFHRMSEIPMKHASLSAFGMTRRRNTFVENDPGIQALLESSAKIITMVGKSSYFQAVNILRVSEEENLAMIRETINFIVSHNRNVIFDAEHFFDGWKENRDYALKTLETARDAGAMTLVLCDTNGGSMPDLIHNATEDVVKNVGISVGIHCHNDCEMAVANSLAAVEAGATHVQGTINGFGERCGNANLISIIANLALKQNYDVLVPGALEKLTELSRFVYEMVNIQPPTNQPYVGRSAFAHKGGMHVSAITRDSTSYEHIHPDRVGNQRRVLVSELSGRSNIIALSEKHNIQNNTKLQERILAKIVSRESYGYAYEGASGSFDLLAKECAGTFQPHFELLKYQINISAEKSASAQTEVIVKLKVDDQILYEVAEGDGPVNALDAAMRKALTDRFPNLQEMQLVDYKVRVINSEAATAAFVRVIIESKDEEDSWGTVGVSENVVEASWRALVDSFEYKLCKDQEKKTSGF
ncbi:MAG: citramalate synthase [Planctomycetia bacterium]|nr:citramalate synthase [Planctomycetia bacterium]